MKEIKEGERREECVLWRLGVWCVRVLVSGVWLSVCNWVLWCLGALGALGVLVVEK